MAIPVITIDGPSGTGKGTISHYLANWLSWRLLDSGALYRALALATEKYHVGINDAQAIADIAGSLDIMFQSLVSDREVTVILEGHDVSEQIRTEECASRASQIAALAEVRAALLTRQLRFRKAPGLIADGRDMGTLVFTDAPLKIYLTASADECARRKCKQLSNKGFDVNIKKLSVNIAERDTRDSQRVVSPLKPAAAAVVIDTTTLTISEVVKKVQCLVQDTFPDICPDL